MTTGVVTVGRKQYASGLYWENSPSGRISQAAKEAARQPDNYSDFYAVRIGDKKGRVPQFGLASETEGLKAGIPSLAGCLANQQPGSWIGAFSFNEGTAVIIVRDDLIVPEGDLFFEDESEARDHLYQEMGVGGFGRIYAPEAWGIPGADSMPITLLLNDKSDVKLHNVVMSDKAKLGMMIGFGLLIAILGAGWFIQNQRAEEEAMRIQQMAALKRMQIEAAKLLPIQQKVEYPIPVRKWEKVPKPLILVDACKKALDGVKIGVAGWRVVNVFCSNGSLTVRWARTSGFAASPKNSIVNETGKQAVVSVLLKNVEPRGDENLVDPDEVTKRYLAQNWPGTIRREPDPPPPPPPPNYSGEWNPPPDPWVRRSFTFIVPVLPWTLPDFFSDLPGVVIDSLSMNGDGAHLDNKWNIKGVIYENRR